VYTHDDTTLKSAIRDLKEKNEELRQMNLHINKFERQADALSVIEARNILAKEIHDVMGHSLNLVLHTLESNKVILDACPGKAIQRLEQVLEDIDAGMREISMMSKRTGDPLRAYLPLNEQLNDMARRLIAVNVRLEIIGWMTLAIIPRRWLKPSTGFARRHAPTPLSTVRLITSPSR
jgi:CRISPR/Cas system-associated endonuclease/helicase Cas3